MCRFDEEFPRLPDMRRVLDTELQCDDMTDQSVHSTQQNVTSSSSKSAPAFHHLDSSLFYSTAPQSDLSAAPVSAGFTRLQYNDEYRVLDVPVPVTPSSSYPVFTLSDVTDSVDAHLLRVVFLLSDVIVLVYRLTATYVTVRALRHHFSVRHCTAGCQGGRRPSGLAMFEGRHAVVDGGSLLRSSSSSRTALTSTSGGAGVVPELSNIYTDPQSLVVENCATGTSAVDQRQQLMTTDVHHCVTSCPTRPRTDDLKYHTGQSASSVFGDVELCCYYHACINSRVRVDGGERGLRESNPC